MWPNQSFQPDKAGVGGCAILSSMLLIVALLGAPVAAPAQAQPADLIIENARIHTLDAKRTVARAVAVRGDRIAAVGDAALAMAGERTRRIDLKGATVVPGLIDAHAHMAGLGSLLESRDLRYVKSVAEIAAIVGQEASKRGEDEWVVLRNWDQTNWGGRFPTARELDSASAGRPVFLARVDGHAGWANSKALALAGITKDTADPPGGRIIRDEKGEATGVLIDSAQYLVRQKVPRPGFEQVKRRLELAARECVRLGLTGVHDAGVGEMEIRAYKELITEGKLPLRIYAMIGGEGELWRSYLAKGPEIGDYLTVRSIKMFADGALGSRGAALWQPYSDEKDNSGLLLTNIETLERVARDAVKHGFQVATHAIGDKANRLVLDAYRRALGGGNEKRFRVEHAQVVSLPDFKAFAELSLVASIQATHATSDMRWAETRLGPDRVAGAYAWRRFTELGVAVANGSDFPVEEPDPLLGLYASITRQDREGNPPQGWMPDQRLSRELALESFTRMAAYAAFEEKVKGTIEVGKFADFTVLNKDLLTVEPRLIPSAKILMTVTGGKVVYQAQ